MTEKTYLDPSPDESKYLVKFTVSQDKIDLYGAPAIMQSNSGLIKSILDKLDVKGDNLLGADVPVNNKEALITTWLSLNKQYDRFHKFLYSSASSQIMIDMWFWLNYFNIFPNIEFVERYTYRLVDNYFNELIKPENKGILDDISKKIGFIDEKSERLLTNKLNKINLRLILRDQEKVITLNKYRSHSKLSRELNKRGIGITRGSYYVHRLNPSRVFNFTSASHEIRKYLMKSGYKLVKDKPIIRYQDNYFTYPQLVKDEYQSYVL